MEGEMHKGFTHCTQTCLCIGLLFGVCGRDQPAAASRHGVFLEAEGLAQKILARGMSCCPTQSGVKVAKDITGIAGIASSTFAEKVTHQAHKKELENSMQCHVVPWASHGHHMGVLAALGLAVFPVGDENAGSREKRVLQRRFNWIKHGLSGAIGSNMRQNVNGPQS